MRKKMILKILCMIWGCCGKTQVLLILQSLLKWNIIIARYGRGEKTIQGIENIHLFAGKGLFYYVTLEWSEWGESDVKGRILVLQRRPLQTFIAYFDDCVCSPTMNVVCLTSRSQCPKLFLLAEDAMQKRPGDDCSSWQLTFCDRVQPTDETNRFLTRKIPFLHVPGFAVLPV